MSMHSLTVRRARALAIAIADFVRMFRPGRLVAALIRQPVLVGGAMICAAGCIYWLALASDRYVSEARIVVQRTDLPGGQSTDLLGGLLGGSAPGRQDQMLIRDYLLSPEMTSHLDRALQIDAHYSQPSADVLSRMWRRHAPLEWLHRHFLSRTRVEFDEYTGILTIQAQAYEPAMAQAITALLVQEGEEFMNSLAHKLAEAQVDFLQTQVANSQARMMAAREDVIAFQNTQGLISPGSSAEGIGVVISRLEGQRTELNVQRATLAAYLVPEHPQVIQINQQIAALDRQIREEQSRLASPRGGSLNQKIEALQRLEAKAAFAQDLYKASLAALERGQMDANRVVKKVSVIQAPNRPEYPLEPRRLYNAAVFVLVVALLAGIVQLVVAIVRDHRD